jgi:predicted transcriptional regulator
MGEQTKSTVITVRLDRALIKAVDKIAKSLDRSRNWVLARYIHDAVRKEQSPQS